MQQISISQARQMLPSLVNRVFNGEEFVIVKNNLKVAKLLPIDRQRKQYKKRSILPEATKLFSHMSGSSKTIAKKLRKESWSGVYDR